MLNKVGKRGNTLDNVVEDYVNDCYSKIMRNVRMANMSIDYSHLAVIYLEFPINTEVGIIDNTTKELIRVFSNLGYDISIGHETTREREEVYKATVKWFYSEYLT